MTICFIYSAYLPERAERNKDFEIDDLLPWSEKNEVVVLGSVSAGNHGFFCTGRLAFPFPLPYFIVLC